jgi:glycosyltransferase involved in cell wall biosynthesis
MNATAKACSQPKDREMRVLHVTEAFGGGISTAIQQYFQFSGGDHSLLARVRAGDVTSEDLPIGERVDLVDDSSELLRKWLVARKDRYDVVHAHSSLAGALVRGAPPKHAAVVYSPHALASAHHGSPNVRRVAYAVERRLACRTDAFGAVSEAERAELATLGACERPIVVVPHAVTSVPTERCAADRALRVIAVGRLSYQKNPESVARMPSDIPEVGGQPVEWLWLGDGDSSRREALARGGWHLAGWASRRRVLSELCESCVLLHPARYEGMPLVVLEAMAAGTPVVAADIPALFELQSLHRYRHYGEAIEQVRHLLADGRYRQAASEGELKEVNEKSGRAAQDSALARLYSASLGARPE